MNGVEKQEKLMNEYTVLATHRNGDQTIYPNIWANNEREAEDIVRDLTGTWDCVVLWDY